MSSQLPLFETPKLRPEESPAIETHQKDTSKPVFGVQASWLCLGGSLSSELFLQRTNNYESWMPFEKAAVSYCYLLEQKENGQVRLQCPALHFDQQGSASEIWHAFNEAAWAASKQYGCNDEPFGCVTTAWKGETRSLIVNNMANQY